MAWIEPYTSWQETDRCTYADINRIAGNVNYLLDADVMKADYTQNDVITLTEWSSILSALSALSAAVKFVPEEEPNTTTTALNFNVIENYILGLKNWIDLINAQNAANIYSGESLFLGESQYLR